MAMKKFFEEYPLYRKFNTGVAQPHHTASPAGFGPSGPRMFYSTDVPTPAINLDCSKCGHQTFNLSAPLASEAMTLVDGRFYTATYLCQSCKSTRSVYFLFFRVHTVKVTNDDGSISDVDYLFVTKVGQFPQQHANIDKALESMLGGHADFYKKGLTSESFSYGIGAYAYYRRIAEDVIDELLESIADLIEGDKKAEYIEALEHVKTTRITQEKIDLVKDLVPASLRPNGMNPLGILHAALSEGLHDQDDETCLEYAEEIRTTLTFLVNKLRREKRESADYTAKLQAILDKRAAKGKGS